MNEQDDNLPPEVKMMMRRNAIAAEHKEAVESIGTKHSESIEHDVLFPLWQLLGDGTPNYWQAMMVITAVTQVHTDTAAKLTTLPSAFIAEAYDTLAKLFTNQAACHREMRKRGEETERQMQAVK